MYKVMIAEDEELILQGIKELIDWESLGLEVIHLVHDGMEAIEAWNTQPVHIVITDINMPRMNGLKLLEKLREENKEVRFIILTGYDEFEFARTAIRMDVEEYILKPIDEEQLTNRLEETVLKLKEKGELRRKLLDKNSKLSEFLEGEMPDDEKEQYMQEIYLEIGEGVIVPAAVKANLKRRKGNGIYDIISYLEEFNEDEFKVLYHNRDQIMILKVFDQYDNVGVKEYFNNMQIELESKYNVLTYIGIGQYFTDVTELPEIYKNIEKLLKYFIIEGYGNVIEPDYLKSRKLTNITMDGVKLHRLILERNRDEAVSYLEDLFISNTNIENISIEHIYQMAFKIALILQDIILEFKLREDSSKSITELVGELYKAEDISSMKGIFIEKLSDMIDQLQIENSHYTPVIKQIISEISNHCKEDANLKTLAYKYHMNTSYLGQIFLKEVGCSFSQYLSNAKNSKARELILNTNMKINDIAKEVGYPDTSYFYRKFKLCYGVSPASLREMKNY